MNYPPVNAQELKECLEKVDETRNHILTLLKGLPPLVQMDAVFSAYMQVATEHGELEKVAHSLMEIAGSILLKQMGVKGEVRFGGIVVQPGQPSQHPAPSTLH